MNKRGDADKLLGHILQENRGFCFLLCPGTFLYRFLTAGRILLFRWCRSVQHQETGYQYSHDQGDVDEIFFLHGSGFGDGTKV